MVLRVVLIALLTASCAVAYESSVRGEKGMVVSSSTLASEVGVDILEQGGNAIDAAVAVGFALAVTYPSAGNLGGGGFLVMRLADGRMTCLDFRETAPQKASRDMYLDDKGKVIKGLSTFSHRAAGVPGTVDGLLRVLKDHGTMSVKQVITPSIALARNGFPLSQFLANGFRLHMELFSPYPASMALFSKKGAPYSRGDLWRLPDLANTLERIAKHGRDGFYSGETADLMVKEMQRGHGLITHEDLCRYKSVYREPVQGTYRGLKIYSMPPPSSGGVLLIQMLNMLESFDLREMGWGSAASIHLMVEAERRAYADRAHYLGDPDFAAMPIAELTSKEYAASRFADFSPEKAGVSARISHGQIPVESPNTTHFSVIDRHGNAVACTTTLNWAYGAHIVVPGAGFLLNNEMDDFSVKPDTPNSFGLVGGKANEIQPGKRMLSSMTPTIIMRDNEVFLVVGSPGGSTIITTVLQVIVNLVDHQMKVSDAISAPRFHHQWLPDEIMHESFAITPDTRRILRGMGHTTYRLRSEIGDVNGILVKDGAFWGMADIRNDAEAVGY